MTRARSSADRSSSVSSSWRKVSCVIVRHSIAQRPRFISLNGLFARHGARHDRLQPGEGTMSCSERMSSVDTTWLRMDNPANLMMIVGVWILEGPVALDRVEKQISDGLMSYRRYRQKVDYTPAGVYWRDDPNFDLAHHIKRVNLPGRGGKRAFEHFVGELASEILDPNHPLWTVHLVEKYEGGAAVVFRMHHAIADGVALMGVTLALVDGPRDKAQSSRTRGRGRRLGAEPDSPGRRCDQCGNAGLDLHLAHRTRLCAQSAARCEPGAGRGRPWPGSLAGCSSCRPTARPDLGQADRLEARRLVRAPGFSRSQGREPGARLLDQRSCCSPCVAGAMRRYLDGQGRPHRGRRNAVRWCRLTCASRGRPRARQPVRHHRRPALPVGVEHPLKQADDGAPAGAGVEDLLRAEPSRSACSPRSAICRRLPRTCFST